MTGLRYLLLAVVVITAPLALPAHWVSDGLVPDLALLAVLYVAMRGTSDRAAVLGVVLGLAVTPWTAAPFAQTAFLLGGTGWLVGRVSGALDRERLSVQCALAFGGVLLARGAAVLAMTVDAAGGADLPSPQVSAALLAVVLTAGSTALAAPFALALIERTRVFRSLEVREPVARGIVARRAAPRRRCRV